MDTKFEDSNMALFGTEVEKNLKYKNAENEPQWHTIPKEPCLMIWRIEKFEVVPWPKEQYGSFYQGDTYIVLSISKDGDTLDYTAFMWVGKESTQDETGTGAYKIVELDDFFHGAVELVYEAQGDETEEFVDLFDDIIIMEGGCPSGFKKVEKITYPVRLLVVTKNEKKKTISYEAPLVLSSLTKEDAFILDTGMELYCWRGENAGGFKKFDAASICNKIKSSRGGHPTIKIFEEGDTGTKALMDKYLEDDLKGGKPNVVLRSRRRQKKKEEEYPKKMFRLCDESGELKMTEVKYGKENLDSKDTFLIDNGRYIFIWNGKEASLNEKRSGLNYAKKYQETCGRKINNAIVNAKEGSKKFPIEKIFT